MVVVVCGGCALVGIIVSVVAMHGARGGRVRGVPGQFVRGWAIAKSFPRSPASAGFGQRPKTAFSDVGCARTAGNGL